MRLGFSDIISVSLDGKLWFEGKNEFHLSPDWNRQGYVHPDRELEAELDDGEHELHIEIQRTEYFGWGLILQCLNEHVEWSSFEW